MNLSPAPSTLAPVLSTARGMAVALLVLTLGVSAAASPLAAQGNPAHAHMGHVAEAFGPAPDGQGLLPTALAEAQVAIQHAGLAARDLFDVAAMQLHSRHVLHAVDPSAIDGGPGLGFGVLRASQGVAQHIGMAGEAEGASDAVKLHSGHVAASASTVAARAEEIVALVGRIQAASTYDEAGGLVRQLQTLTQQLVSGHDADGDGRIGWQEGEGGLEQAEVHMGLMLQAEGLGDG